MIAWVILRSGQGATVEEMQEYYDGQIAYYTVPKLWRFCDSFSMTVTGKVQKYKRRELVIEELRHEQATSIRMA